jgi:hypothetical protein
MTQDRTATPDDPAPWFVTEYTYEGTFREHDRLGDADAPIQVTHRSAPSQDRFELLQTAMQTIASHIGPDASDPDPEYTRFISFRIVRCTLDFSEYRSSKRHEEYGFRWPVDATNTEGH